MRSLIYGLLTANAEFMAEIPGGLTSDRSLLVTPEVRPFAVLIHEGPTAGVARAHYWRTTLWCHDDEGDYLRIDRVLALARAVLLAAPGTRFGDVFCMDAVWEGNSGDLYDDARGTNVKTATFQFVGSGL